MSDNSDGEPSVSVDVLAKERTRLARERTVLAHIRTGFASFLFGGGVIGLFTNLYIDIVGAVFIIVGIVFLLTGWGSYVRSNRRTRQLLEEIEEPFRRL